MEIVQLPQELPFQSEAMAYWIVRHILELSIDILVVSVQPLEYMDMIRKETGNRCKFIYYHHGCPLWEVAKDSGMASAPQTQRDFVQTYCTAL